MEERQVRWPVHSDTGREVSDGLALEPELSTACHHSSSKGHFHLAPQCGKQTES